MILVIKFFIVPQKRKIFDTTSIMLRFVVDVFFVLAKYLKKINRVSHFFVLFLSV